MPSLYIPLTDNGGGDVKASFMLSFIRAFSGTDYDVQIARFGDSHPGRARNKAAASFLESGRDYLLFLDADIVFEPEHIATMMASDEPLICGIYPKKQPGVHLCAVMPEGFEFSDETKDRAVPCRRAGTGFMRIHRSVFEALKEKCDEYANHGRAEWDFFKSGVVEKEWLSEDWYFCDVATRAGFQPMLHTGIQARHEGSAVYPLPETAPEARWQDIPGWFTEGDAECYRMIAKQLPTDSTFAEVGVWQGRSLAAMATFLRAEGKTAELIAVDTFRGTKGEEFAHAGTVKALGGSTRDAFLANMQRVGVPGSLKIIEGDSCDASEEVADHSLDAVFIDAAHDFQSVSEDLIAWTPKVKRGGIIAGHDYDYDQVQQAVELFATEVQTIGRCWYVRMPL